MKNISVIIPVRNEAATIKKCVQSILSCHPDAEIIVVDGGSDETATIVEGIVREHNNVVYIKNRNDRGKGHAIKVGIEKATGDMIAQFDSDLQFDAADLKNLFLPLENNLADMTLGSRFIPGAIRVEGSTPFLRTLGNKIISLLASLLMKHRISDILAGIKAWKREVTTSFTLKSDNYSYEAELPIKALKNNWRVLDIPVKTYPRIAGTSSVGIIKTGFRLIIDLIKFRFSNE